MQSKCWLGHRAEMEDTIPVGIPSLTLFLKKEGRPRLWCSEVLRMETGLGHQHISAGPVLPHHTDSQGALTHLCIPAPPHLSTTRPSSRRWRPPTQSHQPDLIQPYLEVGAARAADLGGLSTDSGVRLPRRNPGCATQLALPQWVFQGNHYTVLGKCLA